MVVLGGETAREHADNSDELHDAVLALSPDERRDRKSVNEAVRRCRENRERT